MLMEQRIEPVKLRSMESSKPFAETIRSILALEDMSQRELARRCEAHGWGSLTMVARVVRGEVNPSRNALIGIAKALGARPETFAEYRLLEARRRLDPDEVGLDAALSELARIES